MSRGVVEARWLPVSYFDKSDSVRVLVRHPDLIDEDFNPEGVAEGVLVPTNDDGTRDAICNVWDDEQDTFWGREVKDVKEVTFIPGVEYDL